MARKKKIRTLSFWQFIRKNLVIISGLLLLPITVGAVVSSYNYANQSSAASRVKRNVLKTQDETVNQGVFVNDGDPCNSDQYTNFACHPDGSVAQCGVTDGVYIWRSVPYPWSNWVEYCKSLIARVNPVTPAPTSIPTYCDDSNSRCSERSCYCVDSNGEHNNQQCSAGAIFVCNPQWTPTPKVERRDVVIPTQIIGSDNFPTPNPTLIPCDKNFRYDVAGCGVYCAAGEKKRCTYEQEYNPRGGCKSVDCRCEPDPSCGDVGLPQGQPDQNVNVVPKEECPNGGRFCPGGYCKDGTDYGADNCAPQSDCGVRREQACEDHGGFDRDKNDVQAVGVRGFDVKKALQNFFGIFGF